MALGRRLALVLGHRWSPGITQLLAWTAIHYTLAVVAAAASAAMHASATALFGGFCWAPDRP